VTCAATGVKVKPGVEVKKAMGVMVATAVGVTEVTAGEDVGEVVSLPGMGNPA
jgi:hypothetical protein